VLNKNRAFKARFFYFVDLNGHAVSFGGSNLNILSGSVYQMISFMVWIFDKRYKIAALLVLREACFLFFRIRQVWHCAKKRLEYVP